MKNYHHILHYTCENKEGKGLTRLIKNTMARLAQQCQALPGLWERGGHDSGSSWEAASRVHYALPLSLLYASLHLSSTLSLTYVFSSYSWHS